MPPGRPRRLPPDARPPFSWIGGALCLDFVNTVSWLTPGVLENERLRTDADVGDWTQAAGITSDAQAVESARGLRADLHRVLTHVARGTTPDAREVDRLNEWIRLADAHTKLRAGDPGQSWFWAPAAETAKTHPDRFPLAPIVHSAVELLRSPELSLLRLCANERCGWLFLDRSRKQNRRWCEMRECGARAKARRYRSRRRSTVSERAPG
jgi:predicted RNA-binding Zn ribbon-like protein